MNDKSTELNTKAKLRNVIFIVITLVLVPLTNLCHGLLNEQVTYAQLDRYSVEVSASQIPYPDFFADNLDKSIPFLLTYLVWVAFAVLGLMLVKLVYRKHHLEKRVFKMTLIAYVIRIGLLIMCGVAAFVFKDSLYLANETAVSIISGGLHFRARDVRLLIDIIFMVNIIVGFIVIYSKPIKHSLIRMLGGEVKTSINQQ